VFRRQPIFAASRRFDPVVCYHVLQRLARQEALALVGRLLTLIGPSGVGVFQWLPEPTRPRWSAPRGG
jgi:hypothetical protein